MKKLLIIRHAKSSWNHPELSDFERPLNERGLNNGPQMADRLRARKVRVNVVLSSMAVRAKHTSELLAEALGHAPEEVRLIKELYMAMPAVYTYYIQALEEDLESAAIIGHNPDLTEWVNALTLNQLVNVPTCGMAFVEFPEATSWNDIGPGKGRLVWFDYPKKPFDVEKN